MILYTTMPPEAIWAMENSSFKLLNQIIDGVPVQVMVTPDGESKIERIFSTNPYDYLKLSCQPGQIVQK